MNSVALFLVRVQTAYAIFNPYATKTPSEFYAELKDRQRVGSSHFITENLPRGFLSHKTVIKLPCSWMLVFLRFLAPNSSASNTFILNTLIE